MVARDGEDKLLVLEDSTVERTIPHFISSQHLWG